MPMASFLTSRAFTLPAIAGCLMACLLGACGHDETPPAPQGPQVATLDGEKAQRENRPRLEALDISKAPTALHGELATLLPLSGLDRSSLVFAGWDAASAAFDAEGAAGATLPCVVGVYRSVGYKLNTGEIDKVMEVEHPQGATVIIIRAPDDLAADTIRDQITQQLGSKGFIERDELSMSFGHSSSRSIQCFSMVVTREEVDSVFIAYLETIGNTVLYALETEAVPRIKLADGTHMERVTNTGFGTRLGGQQLMLILDKMLQG